MKVHHLLFIVWFVVFAFWMARQFAKSNKNYDKNNKE